MKRVVVTQYPEHQLQNQQCFSPLFTSSTSTPPLHTSSQKPAISPILRPFAPHRHAGARCKTPPVVRHLLLKAPSGARGALWSNTADSVGTWATACLVVSRHWTFRIPVLEKQIRMIDSMPVSITVLWPVPMLGWCFVLVRGEASWPLRWWRVAIISICDIDHEGARRHSMHSTHHAPTPTLLILGYSASTCRAITFTGLATMKT